MSDAKPKASLPATPLLSSPCAHSAASRIGERRLRKTKIRVAVLAILLDAKAPLTHADVEQILIEHQFPVDRVSLYRSFSALFDAQLVHRVLAHDGCWRYCANSLDDAGCPANHPHSLCLDCGEMTCLLDQRLAFVQLPQGYQILDKQTVVMVRCPRCQESPPSSRFSSCSSPPATSKRSKSSL